MSKLHEACRSGDLATVQQIIASHPEQVDADDEYEWRPIFHASLGKHLAVVRFLIASGADLASHDGYVLHYAAEVPGNQEIVNLLVQYGALDAHVHPSSDLGRQLLAAIFLNDVNRCRELLRMHPELATEIDGRDDQPIHHAARNGSVDIVRLLADVGASVDAVGRRGHTVLYCAAGHGHLQTVRFLLSRGVDVDTVFTEDGKTVRQWLDQYLDQPSLAMVRELLG